MKKLIFLFAFLFLAQFVIAAEPTQQYSKILVNPLYRQSMTSNTNYTYSLTVSPPDGMSGVKIAMIVIDVWMSPTVNYNLWVNGQSCNNPSYQISTTYSGAGRAQVTFECSNIIYKEGFYNITLRADKNSGASTAWLELTYMNEPSATVDVHGTEYRPGEPAKVWLQLLNSTSDAINTAICRTDIYAPDGSEYIERATMTNSNHDGIYYYNLPAPEEGGVYPAIAKCFYDATEFRYNASSSTIGIGTATGGTTYLNTFADDNTYHDIDELLVSTIWRLDVTYNFTGVVQNSTNNTLGYQFEWHGRWDNNPTNDFVTLYFFNYTSSSWTILPNSISPLVGGADQYVSNSFNTPLQNLTQLGVISPTGNVAIRIIDNATLADGTKTKLKTDYIWFVIDYSTDVGRWTEVMGSSELHVNDWFDYYRYSYANETWNYPNRTLTDFNITVNATAVINNTLVADAVWNYSGTISNNLLSQISNAIWTAASRTLTAFNFFDYPTIANFVWNNTNRNLTYVNTTEISDSVWSSSNRTLSSFDFTVTPDYNILQNYVWNASNRSLTEFNFVVVPDYATLQSYVWNASNRSLTEFTFVVNTTITDNSIATAVWSSPNRSLTEFNFTVDTTLNESEISTLTAGEVWNYTNRALTAFGFDVVDESFVATYVWNETTRELTGFSFPVNATVNETSLSDSVWSNTARYTHGVVLN